jgi:hypothetical protein
MAGANSNIQMTDLDFNAIKNNLKTYLKSQDTLKDYNYEGSALSTLLDVLAFNTQYNAYYLNQIGNEMFLDTAKQRGSVVSQAKVLNYVPKSAIAPSATVNVTVHGVTDPTLTLPKFTTFMSEAIDGVNYNFVTTDSSTVNVTANTAVFSDVHIKQGVPTSLKFTVDSATNPTFKFVVPDLNIDTSSLQVLVQQSSSNTAFEIYKPASNYLTLDGNSMVYFLQEGITGNYEVSFGDNVLGKKLSDGNIVVMTYIVTSGTAAFGANNFVLMNSVSNYSNTSVTPITSASQGGARESIESIKYQAPKSFSAQGRAVTKEDYVTAIQQNKLGYSFDAVSVWGGQENPSPVYGQVFISLKPTGAYTLTQTQKTRLIQDVIKPISVMTVEPTLVDPDYTYIQITANVLYDPKKTNLTTQQIKDSVKQAINTLAGTTLNTFNSTFLASDFSNAINNVNPSIITNELSIQLQKKFNPSLTVPSTYKLYYGAPLKKGIFLSGITSSPAVQFQNPINKSQIIDGIYIEEVPSSTGGVDSISVLNAGFGYQFAPKVTILGDGTGATAVATINNNGSIKSITVTNPGKDYTSAIATVTPQAGDTTGQLGAAIVKLEGQYGTLREFYNNTNNVKTIFNNNVGTVDYENGIITLNSFGPINVDNDLGQLTVSVNPTTSIVSSSFNRIITIDPFDSNAIVVNVTAKTA